MNAGLLSPLNVSLSLSHRSLRGVVVLDLAEEGWE